MMDKKQEYKTYRIHVSGLFAVIEVEATSEEDALYASSEGWGNRDIIWDDAEYDVVNKDESEQS